MKDAGHHFSAPQSDVYLVHQGELAQSQIIVLGERLRDAGLDVILHCATSSGLGNFKAQMKKADSSGAAFAVIVGEDEAATNKVTIKSLRGEKIENNQVTVPFELAVDYLVDQISGMDQTHECCDDPTHIHKHH